MSESSFLTGRCPGFPTLVALAVLALGTTGCSENAGIQVSTGLLRVVHGIPELTRLDTTLDTRELTTFDFQGVSGIVGPGNGSSTLRLSLEALGAEPAEPFLSLPVTTSTGQDKTLVLTGSFDAPTVTTWEQRTRDWAGELTADPDLSVLEVAFGHATPGAGVLDIYLGELGFDPAGEVPVGSPDFGTLLPYTQIESGSYELVLTPPGDPATELFRSTEVGLGAANSVTIIILDSGGVGTGEFGVLLVAQGVRLLLTAQNLPTTMRAMHIAPDTGPVDIFVGEGATEPLYTNLAFGDVTGYVPSPQGAATPIVAYPAGDTTVQLSTSDEDLDPGAQHTLFFYFSSGAERIIRSTDNNRRIRDVAKMRLIHGAAALGGTLDIHVLNDGELPDSSRPSVGGLAVGSSTGYVSVRPGTYNLFLTAINTETVLGGPYQISVASNGIYSLFTFDNPDGETLGVAPFDDNALTDDT